MAAVSSAPGQVSTSKLSVSQSSVTLSTPVIKSTSSAHINGNQGPVKLVLGSRSPPKFSTSHANEPKTFVVGDFPQKRKPPVEVFVDPVKKPKSKLVKNSPPPISSSSSPAAKET